MDCNSVTDNTDLYLFSRCWLQNGRIPRNTEIIRTCMSSKVIDIGVNRKAHMRLLIGH